MAREDIDAIDGYIRSKRVLVGKYPKLGPLIDSWVRWYDGLAAIDFHSDAAFAEAKRRREEINAAMNVGLPEGYIPADVDVGPPPADPAHPYVSPIDDLEQKAVSGLKVIGAVVIGYFLLKAFL